MGSYGIGVSRGGRRRGAEPDGPGLCWPRRSRPSTCTSSPPGSRSDRRRPSSWRRDGRGGLRVLLDDRRVAGVKFADADLLGVPTIVVVGRGVAPGAIEVKDRKTGERTEVALASAVENYALLWSSAAASKASIYR